MPITVKLYTLEELCNENKKIIIRSQDGVEIGIEATPIGTMINFYFGNEVIKNGSSLLIKPIKK